MSDKFVEFEAKEGELTSRYLVNLFEILWVNWYKSEDDDRHLCITFKDANHSTFDVEGPDADTVYEKIQSSLIRQEEDW